RPAESDDPHRHHGRAVARGTSVWSAELAPASRTDARKSRFSRSYEVARLVAGIEKDQLKRGSCARSPRRRRIPRLRGWREGRGAGRGSNAGGWGRQGEHRYGDDTGRAPGGSGGGSLLIQSLIRLPKR